MKKFLLSFLCFLLAVGGGYAEEVTYNVTSTSAVTISRNAPSGSSATYKSTYTEKYQLTKGKSMTLTLSGFAGNKITGIKMSMKSNKSSGSGSFSAKVGNQTISSISAAAFNNKNWHGNWSQEYVDITPTITETEVKQGENIVIEIAATANSLYCKSFTITYESVGGDSGETPVVPTAPTLTESCSFYNAMTVEITNNTKDATVYYTTDGSAPSASNSPMYTAPIEITETTTVKAIAVKDELSSEVVSATYTKIEMPAGQVIDVLNRDLTDNTSSNTYLDWSGKKSNSSAVYSGNSAGGNESIQLRSNNSNSGIVTTTSAGKVKKVTVVWNSNTTNGRTLNVYGKNTPYTSPADLYNTSNDGDLLGTIVYGTSTELEVKGDYAYIGLRSNSGAMYLTSVSIAWDTNISGGGTEEVETLNTPIINPESRSFNKSINITINSNNDGASVYYTIDGTLPTSASTPYEGGFTLEKTATVKAIAIKEGFNDSEIAEATYTKNVLKIEGGITDILTRETTDIEGTSYKEWSGKSLVSNAIYAGQSAGGNDAIQLRSNNSNSGIVTTTKSNSRIRSIVVDWNSNTTDGRTLDIYGKNGGYESPSDLYGESQGTSLGSIVKGTSTELLIDGEPFYTSIGLRSNSGAMYINSIKVTWEGEKWGTIYQDKAFEIPEDVEMYIVTAVDGESVHLEKVEDVLPANTGAIYKANYNVVTDCVDDNGTSYNDTNLLKGTVDATNIEGDAYVLAKVDGVVGLYKAALNKDGNGNEGTTHFLNNANKAYLPASAVTSNVKALKFDFNTTAVENVKVETEGKKVIYDLSGRRVNEMTQPGIYIVNGKKVMVK